ncbi:hypothetical protein PJF56_15945 [Roseofilum sp. BLCC_M91]|uniref:DUF2079 domain-containing protein n=1 Tax=Roseofilum halophilum BLCC-M91 TaxID=3022259 RepID=A0ABT7BMC9_9CYAN|nr:hypothetical protein [Roseofilum halophilum]MDJ1180357.1 hypothetical protein [Roseofilum halophilum BLCC-M91]
MASPDSQHPQSNPEPTILRRFASLVGLLGASLFFTGWIYRSVYFFHFNIELTTLDLPVQSFFIVPIQVLFGDGRAIARTLLALILMIPTLYLSLLGVRVFGDWFASRYSSFQNWVKQKPSQGFWMRGYQLIIEFDPLNFDSIKFLSSLVDESVIVAWVLIILFHLAHSQGVADAQRDIGPHSTLPVVTFITPENRIPLGSFLDKPFDKQQISPGFRVFGTLKPFDSLLGSEVTDGTDTQEPTRVWRLLLERDGWIYLIPTDPTMENQTEFPPVVVVQKSMYGDQMMILSPTF